MSRATIGLIWALAFVVLESVQFVFFGNIFQRVSTVAFGAMVLGITTVVFVGWSAVQRPVQLRRAFGLPRHLIAINLAATASWLMFLLAVQMIEPAVAYTLGAGAMPLMAWAAHRLRVPEGEALRNRAEAAGILIILLAMVWLSVVTMAGLSGFVRGGQGAAIIGTVLALAEGAIFTWLLIFCQRIDRAGVGPGTVFGLRFPLYVLTATALATAGFDAKPPVPWTEMAVLVGIGLLLIVPPLFALQKAVALISTLTISAITALGPFVIFVLQVFEGRVEYSIPTLIGLGIFFVGAILSAYGAAKAVTTSA